ncbi:hypothetical protein QQZ08_001765 [Neonectria magnoliae]|uniref:Uncharacterized protein n=1 Tax=Neonectria magnoliae TaxID=2732573 RepID=A0ABR1IFP4_9HYPO
MLRATSARLMQYAGETALADLSGSFSATVMTASQHLEEQHPSIVEARIQGSTPHISKKDPSDTKPVITVGYYSASGKRLLSIHAHDDGTWKEFLSRSGRSSLGTDKK